MKKFLLYACVALLSCIAFAQTNVVVVLKEGVKKIYEAAAVDSIRINKNEGYDAVVVLKDGKEEKYAAKDIDSIKIEKEAPVPAEETGLTFEYDETAMTARVTGVENMDIAEVIIPSQVVYDGNVYDVTSIGDGAFNRCTSLASIEIPKSVTTIRGYAFYGCTSLKTARVPRGCEIGHDAFPSTCEIEWYGAVPAEKTGLNFIYDEFSMTAGVTYDKTVGIYELDEVEIPSQVVYKGEVYDVISIRKDAFKYSESLTSIEIPESVTIIGDEAFVYCVNLTSIEIPSSVTKIGKSAFEGCSNLAKARVPVSLKGKVESAFPSSCVIEWYDPLTGEIVIFAEETGLNFEYDETTMTASVTGVENKEATFVEIPSKVLYEGKEYNITTIGENAFLAASSLTSIIIPNSVTSIGNQAFALCASLTSIEIPNSVTSIGERAFTLTPLTSIVIPESVTSIGENAFFLCSYLETARVPVSLKGKVESTFPETCEIVWYVSAEKSGLKFKYDDATMTAGVAGVENEDITEVIIPSQVVYDDDVYNVTVLYNGAFEGCKSLTSIEIPNSVTNIGTSVFRGCPLISIVVDKGNNVYDSRENCNAIIKTANNALILGCQNTVILNSVTTIGEYAFTGCIGLASIEIPESVTTIGRSAFKDCTSLTSIEIPESVTTIGEDAFDGCESLESIEIPNSVTTIGRSAFEGCKSLTSIEIPNSVTLIGISAFRDCTSLKTARVPLGCELGFNAFPGGCEIELYDPLTGEKIKSAEEIGLYFEYNKTAMTARVNGVENEDITEVIIPSYVLYDGKVYDVTTIGAEAFKGCTSLTSIEIPNSVTNIGSSAFYGCSSLTSIKIPESVTTIGGYVFVGCTSLTSIEIPNSVTGIAYTFYGCTGLTSIEIPKSVTNIGTYAFYGCTGLTSIEIPKSVTNIGELAFYNCRSLKSIVIPNSVTTIGEYAFADCKNLKTARVPVSLKGKVESAFPTTCEIEWY